MTVAVGRVGVAGHNERVVDAHARGVEDLRHGVDLVDDGHLVGGAGEGPGRSKKFSKHSVKSLVQNTQKAGRPCVTFCKHYSGGDAT